MTGDGMINTCFQTQELAADVKSSTTLRPLMTNALTRQRLAWRLYDWANSAFATTILAALLPVYFVALVPAAGGTLPFPGSTRIIPAEALWGYIVSGSMAFCALTAPWLGTLADHRHLRHRFLILFGSLGAGATAFLAATGHGDYHLVGILFIIANIGFALGNVFYDAFLPTLARDEADLDRLSAQGYALGYVGGGVALLIAFLLVQGYATFGFADQGSATRAAFLLTGAWWGGFALPAFSLLKEDLFLCQPRRTPLRQWRDYGRVVGDLCRHRDLLLFLLAFLLYNDGIQTMITVAAVFGRKELGLSMTTVLQVFLMIQFIAWPASLVFGRLAARYGAKPILLGALILFLGITGYAYTMESVRDFWLLGAAVALLFGGCQAISRSLYASFIPPDKTAEFFAFYTVSGKFASIFGPFLFALVADLTGSSRLSILALALFFFGGIALLAGVNVKRGQALARTQCS